MNSQANTTAVALATTLRSRAALTSMALFLIVYIVEARASVSLFSAIAGAALILLAQGIVTIHNDLIDRDIDRTNKRSDIPLVSSQVMPDQLVKYAVFLTVVCMLIAASISSLALAWLSAYLLLGWLYSGPLGLKNRPISSLVILGLCYGSMPWILAFVAATSTLDPFRIACLLSAGIFSAGIVSLKDFKDVKGDKKYHKQTFLLKFGIKGVRWLIAVSTLLATVLALIFTEVSQLTATLLVLIAIAVAAGAFRLNIETPNIRQRFGNGSRISFFAALLLLFFSVS